MALQQIIDATDQFNQNLSFVIDCGGFDYVDAQIIDPTESVSFSSTNDSGAIQGVSDGNYKSATNFLDVFGINLNNNDLAKNTAISSMYKFNGVGRFLRFNSDNTVGKLILRLYKIS